MTRLPSLLMACVVACVGGGVVGAWSLTSPIPTPRAVPETLTSTRTEAPWLRLAQADEAELEEAEAFLREEEERADLDEEGEGETEQAAEESDEADDTYVREEDLDRDGDGEPDEFDDSWIIDPQKEGKQSDEGPVI